MIFKIVGQATVYATLTFIIIYILSKITETKRLKNWMNEKFRTWWFLGLIYSVGLFFYAFSYWGYHDLGDSARLPIGNGQAIHNGDGTWTYFYPDIDKSFDQRFINNFEIKDKKLCAELENDNGNKFLIFDLKNSEMLEFQSRQEYDNYAIKNKLPLSTEFKDFFNHYHDYWSGWRFYLLP